MSVEDGQPARHVPTYDMTAPAMLRPDQQSETPASGAADHSQEIQIDGRFAPYPVASPGTEVAVAGPEPEQETDMEVDEDQPVEGSIPVVTPILTGEQVMDLCTGAGREALTVADRFRAQMQPVHISPGYAAGECFSDTRGL